MGALFEGDLATLDVADLLAVQHQLTELRLATLARGREVQAHLDARAEAMEQRRRKEAAELGQVSRPPAQSVFGEGS